MRMWKGGADLTGLGEEGNRTMRDGKGGWMKFGGGRRGQQLKKRPKVISGTASKVVANENYDGVVHPMGKWGVFLQGGGGDLAGVRQELCSQKESERRNVGSMQTRGKETGKVKGGRKKQFW